MRKLVITSLVSLVVGLVLVGCGGNPGTTDPSPSPSTEKAEAGSARPDGGSPKRSDPDPDTGRTDTRSQQDSSPREKPDTGDHDTSHRSDNCIPTSETCDGKDNDCDGQVDENLGGQKTTCGTGACESTGKEVCRNGQIVDTCTPGSASNETCNGKDDDCDGSVDEGLTKSCGQSTGQCQKGTKTCTNGQWGGCQGEVTPSSETCNGKDNDCDGTVNEGCECTKGESRSCGQSTGQCQEGTQRCTGGTWGPCQGKKGPSKETCDGKDNDCDGNIDENLTKSCGQSTGVCTTGTKTCTNGSYGSCQGNTGPSQETCDGKDNDCDGQVDENLGGQTTCGIGACRNTGKEVCRNGKMVDTCQPKTPFPSKEVCDGKDNDCDGQTDEGLDGGIKCGKGFCFAQGTQTCKNGKLIRKCTPGSPRTETARGVDADCDGLKTDAYQMVKAHHGRVCAVTLKGKVKCWGLSQTKWIQSKGSTTPFSSPAEPFSHTYTDVAMGGVYVCALRQGGTHVDCIVEDGPSGYVLKEFTESGLTDPLQSIEGGGKYHWCGLQKSGSITCDGIGDKRGGRNEKPKSADFLDRGLPPSGNHYRKVKVVQKPNQAGVCGLSKYGDSVSCRLSIQTPSIRSPEFSISLSHRKDAQEIATPLAGLTRSGGVPNKKPVCGLFSSGQPKCWSFSSSSPLDSISSRTWTTIQWVQYTIWGLTPSGTIDCVDCQGSRYQYPKSTKFQQVDIVATDRGCGITKKDTVTCWGFSSLSVP